MGFLLNIKLLFFLGLETANLTIDKLKKQIQENVTGIQNRHQMGPDLVSIIGTLSLKSLSLLLSVCYKSTQTTDGVAVAGAYPPTSKLGTFLLWSLALSMPIYSNFQINGALGETRKPPDPRFLKQNMGLEVSKFLPTLHLFGNCYKSPYLEPRALTKTSPI